MIINGLIERDPPEDTPDKTPAAVPEDEDIEKKALDPDGGDDVKTASEEIPDDGPDGDPPEISPLTAQPVADALIYKVALPLFRKKGPKKPKKVTLCTLTHADGEYRLTKTKVDDDKLPRTAVHVTGEKGTWFVDEVTEKDPPQTGPGNAIDLHLYMVNNSINSALAASWSRLGSLDIRQLLTYGIVGVVGICIIWAMIGGMI